jgi:hypothetical protein
MISPIKQKEKKEVVEKDRLSQQAFKEIINEVYEIMLGYSRIRKQYLTKNNPILIGNVEFWFNTTEDGQQQIQYNRPPQTWNEGLIRADLDLHFHGLYFKSHN